MNMQTQTLVAATLGRPLLRTLAGAANRVTVISVHQRAINLMTPRGDLLALVAPELGAGPFNIVLNRWPVEMADLSPGLAVAYSASVLCVGPWCINLARAVPWQPRPDWPALAQAWGDGDALLRRCLAPEPKWPLTRQLDRITAHALAAAIDAVVQAPSAATQAAALAGLMGLGPGLTPAGDDWLAGWLLRWRLDAAMSPRPRPLLRRRDLAGATRFSRALLTGALAGWADEPWHALLNAVVAHDPVALRQPVHRILQHGATSGCAMLAGFLHSS